MEKEEINEENIENNQNTDPNEAKYMTFKGEKIEAVNTDEENRYNQLNINMMNLEVIQGRYVFGCAFRDFPQEEQDYLESICTDKEYGPAYC